MAWTWIVCDEFWFSFLRRSWIQSRTLRVHFDSSHKKVEIITSRRIAEDFCRQKGIPSFCKFDAQIGYRLGSWEFRWRFKGCIRLLQDWKSRYTNNQTHSRWSKGLISTNWVLAFCCSSKDIWAKTWAFACIGIGSRHDIDHVKLPTVVKNLRREKWKR